jgi:hypothetical protein
MKRWLLVALVACSSPKQTPAPAPAPTPAPTPAPDPTPPAPDPTPPKQDPPATPKPDPPGQVNTQKLHDKCGPNDACGPGMTCAHYFGIAGPRGPEFKTCEIKCTKGTACPTGTTCGIIADGPGQVCR